MSMFGSKKSLTKQIQQVENETISSIFDQHMVVNGEISFKGKTRIDGTVAGDIDGEHLVLGQSGSITGEIRAATFVCNGTVVGNVKAGIITARKGCSIHGTLEADSLIVEPGASLDGEVKTNQEPPPPAGTETTEP